MHTAEALSRFPFFCFPNLTYIVLFSAPHVVYPPLKKIYCRFVQRYSYPRRAESPLFSLLFVFWLTLLPCRAASRRAHLEQVESEVYSCLESMFDEDEARGLGLDPAGGGGGDDGIAHNKTSTTTITDGDGDGDDESSNSSGKRAAAAAGQDKDKDKANNGGGEDQGGAPQTPAASGASKKKKVRCRQLFGCVAGVKPFPRTRVANERPVDTF